MVYMFCRLSLYKKRCITGVDFYIYLKNHISCKLERKCTNVLNKMGYSYAYKNGRDVHNKI